MLELRDIYKDYPVGDDIVRALKGISVTFRDSEFVSILGQSGCGKTTLLNILGGMDRAEALRRAQLVIDRFGLPADEAPFSLSRGQRQMVALASVVVVEPKIVVLDEPTSGLDYRECIPSWKRCAPWPSAAAPLSWSATTWKLSPTLPSASW